MRRSIAVAIVLLPIILSASARDSVIHHQIARLEAGLGLGQVGQGGGISGRIAISYLSNRWGGTVRLTAHDGARGTSTGGGFFFGPPIEKFFDEALMGSYVLKQMEKGQVISSAGIGFLHGDRLTTAKTSLESFRGVAGFAYEIGMATATSTVGMSLSVAGNINSESNIIALILSITLGYQK